MTTLKIAVVSDIHIGPKARSSDLFPPGSTSTARNEQFLESFDRFVRAKGISADCLVIPGDLSCSAEASEFSHASTIASRIARSLGVTDDQLFFVPGNHDIDWAVLSLAKGGTTLGRNLRWQQRYQPLTQTQNIFRDRATSSTLNKFDGSLFSPPFAGIWETSTHLFVAVNSAAHDCPDEPIHYGFIRDEVIDWLSTTVRPRTPDDKAVRCLILHHHVTPHGNLGVDARDFSVCQNADRLLGVLRDLDFDLIIHGHKHFPRFEIELVSSDHPIAILGAGSFSADLGVEYGGGVQNQFHLISIHGRYQDNSRLYGVVENWAYVFPSGWHPNAPPYTPIPHRIGFGGPLNWKELAKRLQQPIRNRLKAGTPFELTEIGPIYQQLTYVSPDTAKHAIDQIARSLDLDFVWIEDAVINAVFRVKHRHGSK